MGRDKHLLVNPLPVILFFCFVAYQRRIPMYKILVVMVLALGGLAASMNSCCGQDETPSLAYEIVDSQDRREIASFGNNNLGLINLMKTEISIPNGFLQKTRDTALLSFGAEKLTLSDESYLAIRDVFGRQQEGVYKNFVVLNDIDIPFAMYQRDLIKLSDAGIPELADSTTTLLFPTTGEDKQKIDNIASALVNTFGDNSKVSIKTFKWDGIKIDASSMFKELNLEKAFNSDQMKDFMDLFSDPEMWALLEAARDSQQQKRDGPPWYDSADGISCKWGYAQ
jgi:hypothetical protein